MLKTRVISAIIGLPLVLLALFIGGNFLIVIVFLLSILGLYEIFNAFANIGYKPSVWIGYIGAIIYYYLIATKKNSIVSLSAILFIIILILFLDILKRNNTIIDGAITILGMIYV